MTDAATGERASIGDLFSRLLLELRDWLNAEFALYRAEATRRSLAAGFAGLLILAALTLFQGALIALLVGLIMVFSAQLGVGWATAAVVGVTLAIGALLAWIGVQRLMNVIDPDKTS